MTEPVVAVLGEALIDLVENGDDEPRLARPGGSPYNVAIGLARLGRHAAFVGRISRDPLGTVLRRHAERSAVDLTRTVDAAEPSTVALVELVDGVASYRFGVDGTADFCFTDHELAQRVVGARVLHFGSLTSWTPPGDVAVARLVERVRDQMVVSYDPNVRPLLQTDPQRARDQVEASLALAHLVKASDADLEYLYPDEPVDTVASRWLTAGPTLVVITRGEAGATAYRASGRIDRPAAPVSMVDTVGAGDAFTSGLLDGMIESGLLDATRLRGAEPVALARALDRAALVAAVACSRAGANPPRRSELG